MTAKPEFTRRWNSLLVSGFILLLPQLYLDFTSPPENEVSLPRPGNTVVFDVVNRGISATFGDKFVLGYGTIAIMSQSVDMPDRPPVPCRFRIMDMRSRKIISTVEQLHFGAEYYAGGTAIFYSEPFAMPVGRTTVALTNLGCRKEYMFGKGSAGIMPIADHSLAPIAAEILKVVGLLLIALGLILSLARRLKIRNGAASYDRG